jgi:hypothetical protein
MKVKLDENLGRAHVALVRKAGHVAERVTEEGLSGVKDANLWQHICNEGYFFITMVSCLFGREARAVPR